MAIGAGRLLVKDTVQPLLRSRMTSSSAALWTSPSGLLHNRATGPRCLSRDGDPGGAELHSLPQGQPSSGVGEAALTPEAPSQVANRLGLPAERPARAPGGDS